MNEGNGRGLELPRVFASPNCKAGDMKSPRCNEPDNIICLMFLFTSVH